MAESRLSSLLVRNAISSAPPDACLHTSETSSQWAICSMFVIGIDSLSYGSKNFSYDFCFVDCAWVPARLPACLSVCLSVCMLSQETYSYNSAQQLFWSHIINVEHWWIFKIIFGAFNIPTARHGSGRGTPVHFHRIFFSVFIFPTTRCFIVSRLISVNFIYSMRW